MNERMTDCACHDVNVLSPRPSHGVWIASSIATTTAQTNVVFEVMATQRVYDVCARDPRSRRLGFYVVWTRSLLPCHPSVEETSSVSDAFCTCETVRSSRSPRSISRRSRSCCVGDAVYPNPSCYDRRAGDWRHP